jgi:single-stranded DNA-specific DHH superfamily exonuclease
LIAGAGLYFFAVCVLNNILNKKLFKLLNFLLLGTVPDGIPYSV